jgi:hypothetical protein
LSHQHEDQCSNEYIKQVCTTYSHIFSSLDAITSLLRISSGEVTSDHIKLFKESLIALRVGWEAAHLIHTPKLHSLLMQAVPQVNFFGGIGDILEDDIEKMHQIATWTESRVSRLKTANGRALAEVKIEGLSHNNLVKMHVEESQNLSKRNLAAMKITIMCVNVCFCITSEFLCSINL